MNRYFDNGTTSFPKPKEVASSICDFITNVGGSYGRASYRRAFDTVVIMEECRDMVGERLGVADGSCVAWCSGATEAANVILHSLDLKGKRVYVSPLEHNAIMRPLAAIGASISILPSFDDGRVDIESMGALDFTDVALVVVNHQSNVNGVVQPVAEIKKKIGSTALLIDTAQSLGHTDIEIERWGVDYAIFAGHKGLMGPVGIGGLYAKDVTTLRPLIYGGTGSNSTSYDMPTVFPEYIEAGTRNSVGVVGLHAALKSSVVAKYSESEFLSFISTIGQIEGIKVYRANDTSYQGNLFSFSHNKISGSVIAAKLDSDYGIECRYGLHCAISAHRRLGSATTGSVRVAVSPFHCSGDFDYFVDSLKRILI